MPYQYHRLFYRKNSIYKNNNNNNNSHDTEDPSKASSKKQEIDRELPDISKNVSLELTLAMDNGGNNKLLEQD